MSTVARSIGNASVAGLFVLVFALSALGLAAWYDPASARQDPEVLLHWLGLPYLLAFAAAQARRQLSAAHAALVLATLALLGSDLARHGSLLLQDRGLSDLLVYFFRSNQVFDLGLTHCIVGANPDWICRSVVFMALNQCALLWTVFGLIVLGAGWDAMRGTARRATRDATRDASRNRGRHPR